MAKDQKWSVNDNIFGDDPEEDPVGYSEEDIQLASLGIIPIYVQDFLDTNPGKRVLNNKGLPTKAFFIFHLDMAKPEEISNIIRKKLPESYLKLIVKKLDEIEEEPEEEEELIDEMEDPEEAKESLVKQYIEKNGELFRKKEELQEKLSKKTIFTQKVIEELAWIYKLMGNDAKMQITKGYSFNHNEIKHLEDIEELIN